MEEEASLPKGQQGQGVKRLLCATFVGPEAKVVEVESSFTKALPGFSIVGLAGNSIQEAKERVKSALLANNFRFPPLKITINLSPSDLKKSGSHFDLAIALSIALQKESTQLDNTFVFGELGLDGSLKSTASLFALVLGLAKRPIKVIAPKSAQEMLSQIPGIELFTFESLKEVIEAVKSNDLRPVESKKLGFESVSLDKDYYYKKEFPLDFKEVRGQERAKRAALIAAVGFHNILFEGSPGCGKSMIIQRLRYILPPMSLEEMLECAKMEALSQEEPHLHPKRPFRSPHHTSTRASLFGGGSQAARPGEVALAHLGILFFDEFPHFPKSVLEALREPLQDRRILISRVDNKIEYQTKFLFAAAQNPCPCGNLLSSTKECRCTDLEITRYKNRLSEPLLDRIELFVQMDEPKPEDKRGEDSASMHEMVIQAFAMQKKRGQRSFNCDLDPKEMERFCELDPEAKSILDQAIQRLGISHRGVDNLKKVARSVADLAQKDHIDKVSILEALSFRRR